MPFSPLNIDILSITFIAVPHPALRFIQYLWNQKQPETETTLE